ACQGRDRDGYYPNGGQSRVEGMCNEGKGSSVAKMFGYNPRGWSYAQFNDPRLNQIEGGLAKTGEYERCQSPFGIYDLVGNWHEWVEDPPDKKFHGRFRGGSYGNAEVLGHGCLFVTAAHETTYHDYSVGFRCCADAPRD